MRNALAIAFAGLLAACAAENPPKVSPEAVEAAVEHARLEMERAAPGAKPASEEPK